MARNKYDMGRFLAACLSIAGVFLVIVGLAYTLQQEREETDVVRRQLVATMSVVTDIANTNPEIRPRVDRVYPGKGGCAVIVVLSTLGERRIVVCPGGRVAIYKEHYEGLDRRVRASSNENLGEDPHWVDLGKYP